MSVRSILTKTTEDQRSIANRLAAEEKKDDEPKDDKETALSKKDPTLPVSSSQTRLCPHENSLTKMH